MIGVLCPPAQRSVVREFFELFKTPWEFWVPGHTYGAVIVGIDEVPEVEAPIVLVYGSGPRSVDERYGLTANSTRHGMVIDDQGARLPVHRRCLAFHGPAGDAVCRSTSNETVAVRFKARATRVYRFGFDLFDEVAFLLSEGQPVAHGSCPSLDLHVALLRRSLLESGVPLVEIPPAPAGHPFIVCLTHDIDYVSMRDHAMDHSMWGFLYRSTVGAARDLVRRRISVGRAIRMWRAACSLPLVLLGWIKDYWEPFEWYLRVESGLPATYFIIPFKRRVGDRVEGRYAARRATAYDVGDIAPSVERLLSLGCEIGVHGIDAWHDDAKGRAELQRVASVSGTATLGIRMHWLLQDAATPRVLEQAGYTYDSTCGYNDTVGYRAGTTQVFRPLGVSTLLELPMHIQDGALFYPQKMDLSEPEADRHCGVIIDHATANGGVVTLLWHDRSHGPERFWGEFYAGLVHRLKNAGAWFGSAGQVVGWFAARRDVQFVVDRDSGVVQGLRYRGSPISPPLRVRVHRPGVAGAGQPRCIEQSWDGSVPLELSAVAL